MSRPWTCRKCGIRHPSRVTQKCECGTKRPAGRRPKHLRALDLTYEQYAELNGADECGIASDGYRCGRGPTPNRRLDRDHDHKTGQPRGLLCNRHNRLLDDRLTAAELRALADYLDRAALRVAA